MGLAALLAGLPCTLYHKLQYFLCGKTPMFHLVCLSLDEGAGSPEGQPDGGPRGLPSPDTGQGPHD